MLKKTLTIILSLLITSSLFGAGINIPRYNDLIIKDYTITDDSNEKNDQRALRKANHYVKKAHRLLTRNILIDEKDKARAMGYIQNAKYLLFGQGDVNLRLKPCSEKMKGEMSYKKIVSKFYRVERYLML